MSDQFFNSYEYFERLRFLVPTLKEEPGPCLGHSYMGMQALLSLQLSKYLEHEDAAYNGVSANKLSDKKITLKDLFDLIDAERLPIDYHEIGDPETDTKTNQDQQATTKENPVYKLIEDVGLKAIIESIKEEDRKYQEYIKNQKPNENIPSNIPSISAAELKKQIDLAFKIREAVLKKANDECNGISDKKLFMQNKLQAVIDKYPYLQSLLDLEIFLPNTGLYQEVDNYKILKPQGLNNITSVLPLVAPVELDDHGKLGIHKVHEKTRNYTLEKLKDYFAALDFQINKEFAGFTSNNATWCGELPFAFIITENYHAIAIGYNIKTHQWIMLDSNDPPIKNVNQERIALTMLQQFVVGYKHFFQTYSGSALLAYVEKMNKWYMLEMAADHLNPEETIWAKVIEAFKKDNGILIKHIDNANFTIHMCVYANANVSTRVASMLSALEKSLPNIDKLSMRDSYVIDALHEKTLYYWACYINDAATVAELANIVDFNHVERDNDNGFLIAVVRGNKAVIEYLLDHGVDVNLTTSRRETALHIAAHYGYTSIVKLLLKQPGIDTDKLTTDGNKTPLACAVMSDKIGAARLLLNHPVKTDLKEVSSVEESSLYSLCQSNEMRQLLQDYRANMLNISTNASSVLFKTKHVVDSEPSPIANKKPK